MYDDDDDPPEESIGKLYESGIGSRAGRADYALAEGAPALQGEVVEEAPSIRGLFLIAATAGFILALTLWLTGFSLRRTVIYEALPNLGTSSRSAQGVLIQGCRALCVGPIDDLVNSHTTLIAVIRQDEGNTPELWKGIERLSTYALLDGSDRGAAVARRILTAFEFDRRLENADRLLDLVLEAGGQ